MNDEYKNELKELKDQMVRADAWSEKMPLFKDTILHNKLTGEEVWNNYGDRYKSICLNWGINRGWYDGVQRILTNYTGDFKPQYLWKIYINSLTLYDDYNNFDLYDKVKTYFYADHCNTDFYATDDQIEGLLEELNTWFISVDSQLKEKRKVDKVKELEAQLKELKS